MTLRITIVTLIALLLTTTVATIGGLGYYFTRDSVDDLRDQYLQAVSEGVAKGIDALIQPAHPLLSAIRIPRNLKPEITNQEKDLVMTLVSQTKSIPDLTYLDYGDEATGHYIAIRRDEKGQLIFNRAHPQVDSGHEFEWLLSDNGDLSPLPRPETPPYDPRTRDWYKQALTRGFTWTKPYEFFSGGGKGISASLPVMTPEGKLQGVMSLAITLEHLSHYLKSMREDSSVEIYVLLQDGSLVASSSSDHNSSSALALKTAVEKLKQGLEFTAAGTSVVSDSRDHDTYSVTFYPFKRSGFLLWSIAVVIPEKSYLGVVAQNAYTALSVGLLALAIALSAGFIISDRISTPLKEISADLEEVARFRLSNNAPPNSFIQEIAVVGDSVSRMKAGLRSFSRFVPTEEVQKILASGYDIKLGGEMRRLSLHFSDLANFSGFSEKLSPTEVVEALAEYLQILTDTLHSHEGTIAQYTGDGVFAFFNAPAIDYYHALHAVDSALAICEKLKQVNIRRAQLGQFEFINRIGLHTADVVVGHLGTETKLSYSAIGDGVNLASRIEGLNKVYGTSILASQTLKDLSSDRFFWRMVDKVAVVGRAAPTIIYEPIGVDPSVGEGERTLTKSYESALADYFAQKFDLAREKFAALADKASKEMFRRCEYFIQSPPGSGWNGTFVASSK